MSESREVVLPSGRFAKIRPILWGDMVAAYDTNTYVMVTKLAARLVSIDEHVVSMEELLNMEAEEFMPINEMLCKSMSSALKFKDGVA